MNFFNFEELRIIIYCKIRTFGNVSTNMYLICHKVKSSSCESNHTNMCIHCPGRFIALYNYFINSLMYVRVICVYMCVCVYIYTRICIFFFRLFFKEEIRFSLACVSKIAVRSALHHWCRKSCQLQSKCNDEV